MNFQKQIDNNNRKKCSLRIPFDVLLQEVAFFSTIYHNCGSFQNVLEY